jgi:hypothetical protein
MKSSIKSAAVAALGALVVAILPGPASSAQHARPLYRTHPYWQGTPTDRLPIWRYGYYQGNDPDNFIRSQMMRDPVIPNR